MGDDIDPGEQLLLDLDGAVIRFMAAKHASLIEAYTGSDGTAGSDLIRRSISELRDAAAAVLDY